VSGEEIDSQDKSELSDMAVVVQQSTRNGLLFVAGKHNCISLLISSHYG